MALSAAVRGTLLPFCLRVGAALQNLMWHPFQVPTQVVQQGRGGTCGVAICSVRGLSEMN